MSSSTASSRRASTAIWRSARAASGSPWPAAPTSAARSASVSSAAQTPRPRRPIPPRSATPGPCRRRSPSRRWAGAEARA
eukprot:scaffold6877_cov119-Isochrysis_galbana.AAC.6